MTMFLSLGGESRQHGPLFADGVMKSVWLIDLKHEVREGV